MSFVRFVFEVFEVCEFFFRLCKKEKSCLMRGRRERERVVCVYVYIYIIKLGDLGTGEQIK